MRLTKNPVFLHYFSKFMGILLFVLKYMYIPLLLKMINGFSRPAKIMASPFNWLVHMFLGSGGIEKSHSCKWAKWIQWHALPHIQQSTQQRNKAYYPNLHGWDFSIPPSPVFTTNVYYNCYNLTVLSLPVTEPFVSRYKWIIDCFFTSDWSLASSVNNTRGTSITYLF